MTKTQRRKIFKYLTENGWLYKVPIDDTASPEYAIVEGNIWTELCALGMNPRLRIRDHHVSTYMLKPDTYKPLAYLIMDLTTEDRISYRDGNRLNLRQSNIIVDTPAKEITRYRDMLTPERTRSASTVDYELVQHNGL